MNNVINLRQFKKQAARAEKQKTGDRRAEKFGQSKAEKRRDARERAREEAFLDGKKRDDRE